MYVQERKSFRLYMYWYVSGVVVSFLPKKKQTQVGMCVCLWWKKKQIHERQHDQFVQKPAAD
jgi:hypothetical protein